MFTRSGHFTMLRFSDGLYWSFLGKTAPFLVLSPVAARTEYEIGSKRGGNLESSNTDGTREKKANTEEAEAVTPKGHRKNVECCCHR